jgi:hypothetical protein
MPRVDQQDEAVRHALVALNSAYQVFNQQHYLPGFDTSELELYTIAQYNQAISSLQRQVISKSTDIMETTLICCLLFIGIEAARGNEAGATAHLFKGAQIISTFSTNSKEEQRDAQGHRFGRRLSRDEWHELIHAFAALNTATTAYRAPLEAARSDHYPEMIGQDLKSMR